MKVMGWRAWYADGAVYSSLDMDWDALPDDGVISVVLYFDEPTPAGSPLRRIMEGHDFYFKAAGPGGPIYGETHNQRQPDPMADIARRYPGASIKRGMWTDEDTMRRIQNQAMAAKEM